MKALGQLIRLRTHQVREKQKALAQFQAAMSALRHEGDSLKARALVEAAKAEEVVPGLLDYGAYLKRLDGERAALEAKMAELGAKMAEAQADLAAAYQDLKKIEIVRDRQLEEERRAELAAEQAMLDEIALGIERD